MHSGLASQILTDPVTTPIVEPNVGDGRVGDAYGRRVEPPGRSGDVLGEEGDRGRQRGGGGAVHYSSSTNYILLL